MSRLEETTLQQLGLCEHRFPGGLIVPRGESFVLVRWCLRCGDALFDEYSDQPGDEADIHLEEL